MSRSPCCGSVLALLELRDLEARYGEIRALHGVALTVADGDFVALLGANGAGKTTTLRAISGTVKTSGDVLLDGNKLFRRTPEAMARVVQELERRYGDVASYLRAAGLTEAQVDRLRERLVAP